MFVTLDSVALLDNRNFNAPRLASKRFCLAGFLEVIGYWGAFSDRWAAIVQKKSEG